MCVSYRLDINQKAIHDIIQASEQRIAGGDIYPKAIAPVFCVENGSIVSKPMMWGFPLEGKKSVNFNARAENLQRIPLFRNAFPVVIPTSGFYEWQKGSDKRQRFLFTDPSHPLTYIAGIGDNFSARGDSLFPVRFTMITTNPSESFSAFHNREPAILTRDNAIHWLESRNLALVHKIPFDLSAQIA